MIPFDLDKTVLVAYQGAHTAQARAKYHTSVGSTVPGRGMHANGTVTTVLGAGR